MFDTIKAQVALGRFIAFGIDARDIERTICPAVTATDAQILVDDDCAAFLLTDCMLWTTEQTRGLLAVHTLKLYKVLMEFAH